MSEEKKPDTAADIYSCVARGISRLDGDPKKSGSSIRQAKAEKPIWRHAFSGDVCEDIRAWGLLQRNMPEGLRREYGPPSYEENAIFMAMAAYAACGSHADGVSLGKAAAYVDARERFTRLENSSDINEFWRNLKDLLRLITSKKGIGVDYRLLAKSIYFWQFDHVREAINLEREYYYKKGEEK